MKEFIIFDKDGKEIDWYDPVPEEPVVVVTVEGRDYFIPISKVGTWEWRERELPDV